MKIANLRATVGRLFNRGVNLLARWDLTRTTVENQRHWADTDNLSGRSAYRLTERKTARERSRLEAQNNSWYSGMLRTAANHIYGRGPRFQMLLEDDARNAAIETEWRKWCKAINLHGRMRMVVESYWRDGEVFLMRSERATLSPIKLDIRVYEPEQCSQPSMTVGDPTIEDGIKLDQYGNPAKYWFLDHHPGDLLGFSGLMDGNWYDAGDVIHLFRADRPGQLRGFPRCAPAIDWLAHLRRFSKATLSAAEQVALNSFFMKTNVPNIKAHKMPRHWIVADYERGAMNFLPDGWEPFQLRAENPGATNEQYQRTELTYFARCANMPYLLAAGTSRDSNFSSAKMDLKNIWEPEVVSEQSQVEIMAMSKIVTWFFEDIAISTDLLDDLEVAIDDIEYQLFWPPLPVADEEVLAGASETRLATGISTFSLEASAQGLDDDSLVKTAARDNGVTPDEFRKARFEKTFGIMPDQTSEPAAPSTEPAPVGAGSSPLDILAWSSSQSRADNGQFGSGSGAAKHASKNAQAATAMANKSRSAAGHAVASIYHEEAAAKHREAAKSGNAAHHNAQAKKHEKMVAHHDKAGNKAFKRFGAGQSPLQLQAATASDQE